MFRAVDVEYEEMPGQAPLSVKGRIQDCAEGPGARTDPAPHLVFGDAQSGVIFARCRCHSWAEGNCLPSPCGEKAYCSAAKNRRGPG